MTNRERLVAIEQRLDALEASRKQGEELHEIVRVLCDWVSYRSFGLSYDAIRKFLDMNSTGRAVKGASNGQS